MFEETSGKHYKEILSESRICQYIRKTVYCAEFRGGGGVGKTKNFVGNSTLIKVQSKNFEFTF